MKHFLPAIIIAASTLFASAACFGEERHAQQAKPAENLLTGQWEAMWITCPDVSPTSYGVFHFRRTFNLADTPESFVVNVSADNRYRLFVNGEPVVSGPARGDLMHWYYETVDIAPFLKAGENVIAAKVWNLASLAPFAQLTHHTAFILQGNSQSESMVNTNEKWKVWHNTAYSPCLEFFQGTGATDIVDGSLYPWGWEKNEYDDSGWTSSVIYQRGKTYGSNDIYEWVLYPREIPLMEESMMRLDKVRRTASAKVPDGFLEGSAPLVIPANTKDTILVDQSFETTAYPELTVSGGKGSTVKLRYCEALFNRDGKGNRNDIDGRVATGTLDIFHPDGGEDRMFRPLWFRCYRYIQMEIETGDEPLTIKDLHGRFTAYPFEEVGSFSCDRPEFRKIWDVGWRTARLCANETYFDCPYYEQLQYVGDTRVQALISLYVSGDDRLMRQAINAFYFSKHFEGITQSRYPNRVTQYIPTYSLFWINMIHDYWMYRDDPAFVRTFLTSIDGIIQWYADRIDPETGVLGPVPQWNFIDWADGWPTDGRMVCAGSHLAAVNGGSEILSAQLAYALKDAAELMKAFGKDGRAKEYEELYDSLASAIYSKCWDDGRGLIADDIEHKTFSQHGNILGILSDVIPMDRQKEVCQKVLSDTSLIQTTLYFKFYLFEAMKKAGLADLYCDQLKPWQDMIDLGLTTFAETPEPTRSDCHAWSACPLYNFLATICGVTPAEPGFKSVNIEPHLGTLKQIDGVIPHPDGLIKVSLKKNGKKLKGTVTLPQPLSGTFRWEGQEIRLHSGVNKIST